MRAFQRLGCAQVVCDGHGFMRNLRDSFYRLGEPSGDPRLPHAPRLVCAWADLTQILAVAYLSPSTAHNDALGLARAARSHHDPTTPYFQCCHDWL